MNTTPVFLSENEERVLRRAEQLAVLRRAGKNGWRDYVELVVQLLLPAWIIYNSYFGSGPKHWFFILPMAALAVFPWVFFIIKPMRRRIDAREELLETEIKRSSLR